MMKRSGELIRTRHVDVLRFRFRDMREAAIPNERFNVLTSYLDSRLPVHARVKHQS